METSMLCSSRAMVKRMEKPMANPVNIMATSTTLDQPFSLEWRTSGNCGRGRERETVSCRTTNHCVLITRSTRAM